MNSISHRIHIQKEALKFSSAHMTVYPDGQKESLHGHNYSVRFSVDLKDISLKQMISFSEFKLHMKNICKQWDEKVLLARDCPFFKITHHTANEIEFVLCEKRYVLPSDETVLLPLDNITTETLAFEFCRLRVEGLKSTLTSSSVSAIHARVEEIPGQGSTCTWKI
jgi:6-pyruvoyltetrahydropterin/6-carboxytetrahydropterin synthase